MIALRANGVDFRAYARGPERAPLALALHGFPGDPRSLLPLADALAAAGYRVLAPYLRGYGPTGPAPDGRYDPRTLGRDVLGLIEAAGSRAGALVVGHDWGAVAGYAAAALEPRALRALVALAVPPPGAIVRNLRRDPGQLRRSAYMGLARLPGGAQLLRARNYALIERLWRRWSPGWSADPQHLARIKHTFDYPGTPEAALAYYRGLLSARPWVLARTVALLTRPLEVPTLVLGGEADGCLGPRLFAGAADGARAPLTLSLLPGVGHWPHLEQPEAAHAAILDWARQHAPAPRPLPRAT